MYYDNASNHATHTTQVEGAKNSVFVYPNPVNSDLNISLEVANPKSLFIKLFNIQGQCLLDTNANNTSNVKLNLSKIKKGTYVLLLQDEHGFSNCEKIVKQ